jgi:hypothetical protein
MGSLLAAQPDPSFLLRRTPQLHQLLHDALQPDVALPSVGDLVPFFQPSPA